MGDAECVALLQWALPRLELRWAGFRRVRGQVCKRIRRRVAQLGLGDLAAYRSRLEADPAEWKVLDNLCIVTISRFYRDRMVWERLRDDVLPAAAEAALAAGDEELRCWSIGCASGEEPYTLALLWAIELAHRYARVRLRVLGTDRDEQVLRRARAACYPAGALRGLPRQWLEQAFEPREGCLLLRERFRAAVELRQEDVRRAAPDEVFRIILCRNSVLTYFDGQLQRRVFDRILMRLAEGGACVVGRHEEPPSEARLTEWHARSGIYRHASLC